jgi:peptidoglycan/xylan/chitin deacetylase (PgdA/CDA1 family)
MMPSRIKEQIKNLLPGRVLIRQLGTEASDSLLLTFDDGPHAEITPAVLDRLRAFGARGVFFVVGQRIEQAPALLRRIRDEGHLLGNHSYHHIRHKPFQFRACRDDLLRCQSLIQENTGERPVLYRPPFGQLTAATLLTARWLGLRTVTWSVDSDDWRSRTPTSAELVVGELLDRIAPRDIVLLHDDHPGVLTILDRLLPVLKARHLDLERGVDWLAGLSE